MPKISSRRHFLAMTAMLAASAILPTFAHTSPAKSQNQTNLKKMIKNIVLVHGAFADGSCYAEVILHLQEAGINAVVVQNPLSSLERQNAPMKGLSPDANGEIFLLAEAFADVMANDLSASRVLAALQTPINTAAFNDKIGDAAWHKKPSFYLLTKNYYALAYEVQQRFAKQINAKTKELYSGHLSMISKPKELANWLIEIANLI